MNGMDRHLRDLLEAAVGEPPRRVTAEATTPAQGPLVIVQARSPTAIVWLVPSVIAAIRMALLRKITPLPRPSLFRPVVESAKSLPTQAA